MSATRQQDQWPKETTLFVRRCQHPSNETTKNPQVYRGPCEVAVQVTGQQLTRKIFTFKTSFFFNEKTLEPKNWVLSNTCLPIWGLQVDRHYQFQARGIDAPWLSASDFLPKGPLTVGEYGRNRGYRACRSSEWNSELRATLRGHTMTGRDFSATLMCDLWSFFCSKLRSFNKLQLFQLQR